MLATAAAVFKTSAQPSHATAPTAVRTRVRGQRTSTILILKKALAPQVSPGGHVRTQCRCSWVFVRAMYTCACLAVSTLIRISPRIRLGLPLLQSQKRRFHQRRPLCPPMIQTHRREQCQDHLAHKIPLLRPHLPPTVHQQQSKQVSQHLKPLNQPQVPTQQPLQEVLREQLWL